MNHEMSAYGLWSLVIINSLVFILFAFSFTKPKTKRDWRTFGAFSAFIIALFTEMYGFPLTIYLLSGWLAKRFPQVDLLSHDMGHLWYSFLGFKGDPHFNPIHLLSSVFIAGGFILLAAAWRVLHAAQQERGLATTGAYAWVRHPQYDGFILIMLGFLLQWPTIPTLVMFPILVYVYARLAGREEQEVRAEFGEKWDQYAAETPAFIPRLRRHSDPAGHHGSARA
jgi:protein-S-isoprenylcysteine O-methyltransferase Ste14